MEQTSIKDDFAECLAHIAYLCTILQSDEVRISIIKAESHELINQFNDNRRTALIESDDDIEDEDLIPPEQLVITLSAAGYIKTQPLSLFESQRRGGKGKSATRLKAEDRTTQLLVSHTHDHLLCFSTAGKIYTLRVFSLPSGSRYAGGKPIVNCLPLSEGEKISALLTVKNFDEPGYVFMTTRLGVVKKVDLSQFAHTRSSGIISIDLDEGDLLEHAFLTDGSKDIMLFANNGKAIRFHEDEVRSTGRSSRGVRGMRLNPEKQHIISAVALDVDQEEMMILTASCHGYGKCTYVKQFLAQARGGMGVIAMSCSTRNGEMIGALLVHANDHVMFLTEQGMILRTQISAISVSSRNTQGVRLLRLKEDDLLRQIQSISIDESDIEDENQDMLVLEEAPAEEDIDESLDQLDTDLSNEE
jgi:DNA gyrase subunit A